MDALKKFWKKNRFFLLILLAAIIAGGGYGYIINSKIPDNDLTVLMPRYLEALFFFVVAIVLQIALHETGHMLAGLLRGWKFISFMLFGVILSHKDGKFHLSRFSINGAGGQCLMMPPPQGDSRNGIIFYNAGGYLMNLVIALLSAALLWGAWSALSYEAATLLLGLSLSGLCFAAMNGIPAILGGIPNDGCNIVALKKDAFAREIFIKSLRTIGLMQQGHNLLDLNPGYFCVNRKVDYTNPIHAMALSYDLSLAVALHEFERAHEMINPIFLHETEIVPFYMNEIRMETIYLFLVDPDPSFSPFHLLDKSLKRHVDMQESFRPTAIRLKYAWNKMLYKDEAEAERLYALFDKVCQHYYIPGELAAERELIDFARNHPPIDYQEPIPPYVL